MDKNKKATSFKIFLKSVIITVACIALVVIGFLSAGYFAGML